MNWVWLCIVSGPSLTLWPLGDIVIISNVYFSNTFQGLISLSVSYENALLRMPQNLIDYEFISIEVMAWCHKGNGAGASVGTTLIPNFCIFSLKFSRLLMILNSASTVSADDLAPNGARPSAGTVLTLILNMYSSKLFVAVDDFVYPFLTG